MPIIGSFSGQYGFGRGGGGGSSLNPGEVVFTKAGTYTWVAPQGVTSVNVVCIGGGGAGGVTWSSGGGGGGGLGWKNNIPVSPGSSYTVVVGAGGSNGVTTSLKTSNAMNSDARGDTSYFINESTVAGYGSGRGGPNSDSSSPGYGGGYTGDGGGRGGNGAYQGSWNYGGAGAGGYNGRGANSIDDGTSNGVSAPSGSGGGGTGGWYSSTYGVPAGGGTGLYGRTNDGLASGSGSGYPNGGYGGSGGGRGVQGESTRASESGNGSNAFGDQYARGMIFGGFYGGGGGGSGTSWGGGSGGCGAVRIMWGRVGGQVRSFPTAAAWASPITPASDPTQLRYEQEAEFLKDIGCPQLWYKNSDIASLSDGTGISTWSNSGSYGPAMDLVNNFGPYYGGTVNKITDNGRAAANFAGNQYMRFRLGSNLVLYGSGYYQTWSLFVAYRDWSSSNTFGFLGNYGSTGNVAGIGMTGIFGYDAYANGYNNDGFPVIIQLGSDSNWIQRGVVSSSTNSNNQSNYSFSDSGATRSGSGYYSQGSGDNNFYAFDGYSTNRTSPNGGPFTNGSGYGARLEVAGVGSMRSSANNGYLGELIWFDRALNDTETTAVRKYLNARLSV